MRSVHPSMCTRIDDWPLELEPPSDLAMQPCWGTLVEDFGTYLDNSLPAHDHPLSVDQYLNSAQEPEPPAVAPPRPTTRQNTRGHTKPLAPRPRPMSREQRRKARNRTAQQQWRQRQKSRAEDLETRVKDTIEQLEQLQAHQKQLEAKNAVLELQYPDSSASMQHVFTLANVDLTELARDDCQQMLVMTIMEGPVQIKTKQEVRDMPFTEFAMLTAAYSRKLGDCLLRVTEGRADASSPSLSTSDKTAGLALPSMPSDKTVSSLYYADSFVAAHSLMLEGKASSNSPQREPSSSPTADHADQRALNPNCPSRSLQSSPGGSSPVVSNPGGNSPGVSSPGANSSGWNGPGFSGPSGNSPSSGENSSKWIVLEGRAARHSPDDEYAMTNSSIAAGSPVDELRKWTWECSSLRAFMMISNPSKYASFIGQRLDGKAGPGTDKLDEGWYQDLLAALQFSEAQQEDLMLLRRLFYGKLGVLSRSRKDCLKRMPFGAATTAAEINGRLAEVAAIAQELHDITAEEFQTKLQFTSTYRRGIYSLTQQAISMVQAFPYIAEKPIIFDILAAERGEPSAWDLMQPAGLEELEHNVRWQQVTRYLTTVTADVTDFHVPLMPLCSI